MKPNRSASARVPARVLQTDSTAEMTLSVWTALRSVDLLDVLFRYRPLQILPARRSDRLAAAPWEMCGIANFLCKSSCLSFWIVLCSFTAFLWGQSTEDYYRENCELCHTIGGGDQLGPDLQNVSQRQSREWLVDWLLDPEGVLASGDVYANELLERYGGLPMFPSPGMDRELANALLDYIDERSALVDGAATPAAEPSEETAPPPSPQAPSAAPATDQATEEYFMKNCQACHTIGSGALLGPDLKDLSQRQSREWLVDWILDPQGVLASGDPYAVQLQKESRGAVMPRSPGMNRDLAVGLLDYIDQQSGLARPEADDSAAAERPLTLEDVEKGRALFTGKQLLENGGPACIACHNVTGLAGLAGGRLGPDLTRAYGTLGGRPALSAWLNSPPSPTMIPIYRGSPLKEDEIIALIAYLQYETRADVPATSAALVNFLLFGLGGAAVLLVIFDRIWGRRFKGVRRSLVGGSPSEQ